MHAAAEDTEDLNTAGKETDANEEVPEELLELYARSAVLMDADSGRVLFGKNENEMMPMASTTKIMTCILVLEHGKTEETAEVSSLAAGQPEVRLGVREGEKYRVEDLLYSLMLESHNDSAVVLAEHVAGSVEDFAGLMNAKALEIGCKDTYFITPNGLDASDETGRHATTAADLARIMRYCIMQSDAREEFLAVTRTKSYQFQDVSGSRTFSCTNHNAFLDMMEGALSGKTGFTADAGYCYVGVLKRDERTFIVALLACGWPNDKGYKWTDTKKLMNYGLEHYAYRDVWELVPLSKVPVSEGIPTERTGALSGKSLAEVQIEDPPQELKILLREDEEAAVDVVQDDSLQAPVESGQKAGHLKYWLDDFALGEWDIVVVRGVEKRTIKWCAKRVADRFLL